MIFSNSDRRVLLKLAEMCKGGKAIVLKFTYQLSYWQGLEARGYVTIANSAISEAGSVDGHFIAITEKALQALARDEAKL